MTGRQGDRAGLRGIIIYQRHGSQHCGDSALRHQGLVPTGRVHGCGQASKWSRLVRGRELLHAVQEVVDGLGLGWRQLAGQLSQSGGSCQYHVS